jgi:hypothetical protein
MELASNNGAKCIAPSVHGEEKGKKSTRKKATKIIQKKY